MKFTVRKNSNQIFKRLFFWTANFSIQFSSETHQPFEIESSKKTTLSVSYKRISPHFPPIQIFQRFRNVPLSFSKQFSYSARKDRRVTISIYSNSNNVQFQIWMPNQIKKDNKEKKFFCLSQRVCHAEWWRFMIDTLTIVQSAWIIKINFIWNFHFHLSRHFKYKTGFVSLSFIFFFQMAHVPKLTA